VLGGIRDWGHGFWVHRVDKFGRVRPPTHGPAPHSVVPRLTPAPHSDGVKRGTMSGGQKEGRWDNQAVPGWEYVEALGGEGHKTHWRCVFCKKEQGIASDVALSWQGFWGFWVGISLCVGGGMFRQAESLAAKRILGAWQRARNEQKESKQDLKDTRKTVWKVRAGDYHSECFAWDVEDEVESDAKVPEVEDEVAAESENSEDSDDE
jgi:hypothetical protein